MDEFSCFVYLQAQVKINQCVKHVLTLSSEVYIAERDCKTSAKPIQNVLSSWLRVLCEYNSSYENPYTVNAPFHEEEPVIVTFAYVKYTFHQLGLHLLHAYWNRKERENIGNIYPS